MPSLPTELYTAGQARELDRVAIEGSGVPAYTLMCRAGEAAYAALRRAWPDARRLLVACGPGNNGGDGYVLARLALADGLQVQMFRLGTGTDPQGAAAEALADYRAGGGVEPQTFGEPPEPCDVVVDALFGIGLSRPLEAAALAAVTTLNDLGRPILALDIPSGLCADTGRILGAALRARRTVSFIGLKCGLVTAQAPECVGVLEYAGLDLPGQAFEGVSPRARLLDVEDELAALGPRPRTAHKGRFGHVLIVGGDAGMGGAVRLAGEAALRSGAGLVSVATRAEHLGALLAGRPELMVQGIEQPADLGVLAERAGVIALGPGLGQGRWGQGLFARLVERPGPCLLDADALNLLARDPLRREDWVLTPHPGEAARLLGVGVGEIEDDRYAAAEALRARYGGVCLLKGAGTIICGPGGLAVCAAGNPGMASGGMGDALSGIIAALMAQGHAPEQAARLGVCVHARAGDLAAGAGERGLLAGDLIAALRGVVNP